MFTLTFFVKSWFGWRLESFTSNFDALLSLENCFLIEFVNLDPLQNTFFRGRAIFSNEKFNEKIKGIILISKCNSTTTKNEI